MAIDNAADDEAVHLNVRDDIPVDADDDVDGTWGPIRMRVEELISEFYEARPYFYFKGTEGYKNKNKKLHEQSVLADQLNELPSNNKGR